MKTSLNFEVPPDLSVGTVRIEGRMGTLTEWIATPGGRRVEALDAEPGFYIAEIAPAGVRPQSVIFEVQPNVANTIVAPVFSALSAEGNGPTFLNVSNKSAAVEALSHGKTIPLSGSGAQPDERGAPTGFKRVRTAEAKKRLTVGLAREADPGRESWRPFAAPTSVELSNGTLSITVHDGVSSAGPRVRLSLALERVRVERLLLPLYRGGTVVSVAPSQLSTADVALQVTPLDVEKRALLRALGAGTRDEALALKQGFLQRDPLRFLAGPDADPWAAMLALLLTLRFPDVFDRAGPDLATRLLDLAPWAYDAHVIHARVLLTGAGSDPTARDSAAREAVAALARASALGSPYYSYSNQLIGEMLAALGSAPGIAPKTASKARTLLATWQRNLALQCGSSGTFSWRRRDAAKRRRKLLAPDRTTTGSLNTRSNMILFRGRVELGRIAVDTAQRASPKSLFRSDRYADDAAGLGEPASAPPDVPAMRRPPGPPDDPNKGRFGGEASRNGFSLRARFDPPTSRSWVTLTLTVEADGAESSMSGGEVYFCLHPTFDATWIKARFRGQRAALSLKAWGGFTVGAWLPERQVELELDLAELREAPSIIREL